MLIQTAPSVLSICAEIHMTLTFDVMYSGSANMKIQQYRQLFHSLETHTIELNSPLSLDWHADK